MKVGSKVVFIGGRDLLAYKRCGGYDKVHEVVYTCRRHFLEDGVCVGIVLKGLEAWVMNSKYFKELDETPELSEYTNETIVEELECELINQ